MFSQMASLVSLQGETIDRIDQDVEAASEHIKAGETELFKYFRSVNSHRRFIVYVFLVLVFMIILFAVIY